MSVIRLTTDEFYEVLTFHMSTEEEVKVWNHIEENGFLFNEYILTIKGKYFGIDTDLVYRVWIKGEKEEQKIKIREIIKEESGKLEKEEYETTINQFLSSLEESLTYEVERRKRKEKGKKKLFEADHILAPMYFMRYCIYKAMNREYIEVTETKKRYKPIKERAKAKPKTEYKLFEIIRKYERHINHNRHNMTCEHWEVKGHFRHYKNGKVVYIKPFSKGKNKEAKVENRIYKL